MTPLSKGKIFICRLCPGAAERLAAIQNLINKDGWQIVPSDCLSGCRSGGSIAIRSRGKMAYLFGPLGEAELTGLLPFLALYQASKCGDIQDATSLGALRFCALARIPAVCDGD